MAWKYPDLFDGIEVGASANDQPHTWPGELNAALVTHDDLNTCGACSAEDCGDGACGEDPPCPGFIPFAKLDFIRSQVIAACLIEMVHIFRYAALAEVKWAP